MDKGEFKEGTLRRKWIKENSRKEPKKRWVFGVENRGNKKKKKWFKKLTRGS